MNIKTKKTTDCFGVPNGGVVVTMDINGPDDANTKAINNPKVSEVDLGNGVRSRRILDVDSPVVGTEEVLDILEDYIKEKEGFTRKAAGLKKRADL